MTIDIVDAVARYVPVTLGHKLLGVPVAAQPGSFELTPEMLNVLRLADRWAGRFGA